MWSQKCIIIKIHGKNKYNTRSSTKRFNHATTFKNALNMFKMDAAEKITTHLDTDYLAFIEPKKDTIAVKPVANHVNFNTHGKILGYIDLFKMDAPV